MRDLVPYFADLIEILLAIDAEARVLGDPEVTTRDDFGGDLSLTIAYADGSRLDVALQADCSSEPIVWGDYAFHYAGTGGALRLRFDNAPHYHGLPNFPHHLHLATGEILPDGPPAIREVADAIRWCLANPGRTWRPYQ